MEARLKEDKAKTTAIRISELGLVEMTRKRTRQSLVRTLYEPCFFCDGTGMLQSKETVCHEIFRQMRRERDSLPGYKIVISAHPAVCDMLEREERASVDEAARRLERYLRASVELMQVMARACGHNHLSQFSVDDLATWREDMARLSGVRYSGFGSL